MSCKRIGCTVLIAAAALLGVAPLSATAGERVFRAQLDPVAFDRSTRADVVGIGSLSATLAGNTLTVTGTFAGLASPATTAHLRMGLAKGVPGEVIGELAVTHAAAGVVNGKLALTAAQLAALGHSAVYVQLESIRARDGTLWGWLEGTR